MVNSFVEVVRDRLGNAVLMSYLGSFVAYNYTIFIALFSGDIPSFVKIDYIGKELNKGLPYCMPIIGAFFILIVFKALSFGYQVLVHRGNRRIALMNAKADAEKEIARQMAIIPGEFLSNMSGIFYEISKSSDQGELVGGSPESQKEKAIKCLNLINGHSKRGDELVRKVAGNFAQLRVGSGE